MGRFSHFSRHALKRIKQRTGVNYFSIADILDGRMAVDIGQEPVFGRRHWLFYSEPDDCCFVAIQDSMSGLVITVLPLEYHANLAWKISLDDCQKAKTLATSCAGSVASSSASNIPPSIIIVKARYASVEGYAKATTLIKFKASDYNSDLCKVLNDGSFESEIIYQCRRKAIDPSALIEVCIALGNDGEPLIIHWNKPEFQLNV